MRLRGEINFPFKLPQFHINAQRVAPHLLQLGFKGASAPEGMFPAYPSLTFPNHITIVTGLYPEHHGIVGNTFWDPAREQTYVYTKTQSNSDGSWYSGTPLWVLAEQQGMRSACLFWPGSEAEIQGKRPSYYLHFDDKLDDEKRVDQVVAWLKLPPDLRRDLRRPELSLDACQALHRMLIEELGRLEGAD